MAPPRYDPRKILTNWNIGNLKTVKKTEIGVVNQNWSVRTTSGRYVLRSVVFETSHDLRFELGYLSYLKTHGFPYKIPSPVPTSAGWLYVRVAGTISWLYRHIEGEFKTNLAFKEIRQVARMMATYHSLIERSPLDNGISTDDLFNKKPVLRELRNFQAELSRKAILNPADRIFLKEVAELVPLLESLAAEVGFSKLKRYPLHRDITPDNLVWRKGKLVGLIDFENVGRYSEPLVKDISVFFQHACRKRNLQGLNLDLVRYFLHEYRKHHSLTEIESKLIPDLTISGFIEDFSYAYWMLRNDPQRAKPYRLSLYSTLAQSISKRPFNLTE